MALEKMTAAASSSLGTKAAENALTKRIEGLERELLSARNQLTRLQTTGEPPVKESSAANGVTGRTRRDDSSSLVRPPSPPTIDVRGLVKRGYLFRWNDRGLGWNGTKWELRFISLEHGHLSYYRLHTDSSPRYVLSLRGCGVHDDGWKRNRRHRSSSSKRNGGDPPLEEPGAYFFVFSIYLRSENIDDDANEVVPLLRFSTPSMAEKTLWMQLLSDTCDYCDTDSFLEYEEERAAEEARQRQQQAQMSSAMPEAREGTLPPLFFAPSQVNPSRLIRRPSFSRKPLSKEHRLLRPEAGDLDKRDARSKKAYPPSKPMHRAAQPSYLSSEAKAPNYRGLLNLGVVLLVLSNFRLLLDTIHQHGFVLQKLLVESSAAFDVFYSPNPRADFPFLYGLFLLGVFLCTSFSIEWLLGKKRVDETLGMTLHQLNTHASLMVPTALVWKAVDNPLLGGTLLFVTLITWMKLVSYMRANEDYRLSSLSTDTGLSLVQNLDRIEEDLKYPQNITLSNLLYFWCAPTLTYQLAFPKYPERRWWYVATLLAHMVLVGSLATFLIVQVVMPLLENLVGELEATGGTYTVPILAKYWLRLSIASTYTWLMVFYLYFHCFLNLLAELLRFGDRVFYRDWWNSCKFLMGTLVLRSPRILHCFLLISNFFLFYWQARHHHSGVFGICR